MEDKKEITIEDFHKIDVRVGLILEASPFEGTKKPAYQLKIDFGAELGIKKSSAQLTQNYKHEGLVGKKILAVVNFPPRQIAKFMSEVLVLGVPDANGNVVLVAPESPDVPLGGRLY